MTRDTDSTYLHQLAATALHEIIRSGSLESVEKATEIVTTLLQRAVAEERERCASLCRERAAVWRRTLAANSPIAAARDEARARANEAAYLADRIATNMQPAPDETSEAVN